MDNLEKLWCHSVTTDEKECGRTISCSYAEDIACFITDKNYLCTYQHYKLNSTAAAKKIAGNGKLKRVHYLSFYDTIFASTDFDLYVFGRHTFQTKFYLATHKCISELCWNPTETTLAVTFDSDEISLYNFSGCQFELQYTADLQTEVSDSVYVGWGSFSTQFQAPRSQEQAEEVERIPMCYQTPKIVWRSQGDILAVNYYKNGRRFIKVFNKELTALYVTEEYTNLGRPLSFMSQGQSIASSAVRNNVNTIVIFEKNCKLKLSFAVPENQGHIKKLEYHPHMNMLAVYSVDNGRCGYINIYVNVNCKWDLKQQLLYPPTREVRDFQWVNMPEAAYTICKLVVFTAKNVEYHTFRFIVNRCPRTSVIAVTNGKKVKFYNFAEKVIPPPMQIKSLTFPRPVNYILFHPRCAIAIVIDSKLQVSLLDLHTYTKLVTTDDLDLPDIANFHNILWNQVNNIIINIAYTDSKERTIVKEFSDMTLHLRTFEMKAPQYLLPYNDTNSLVSHKILKDHFCALMYVTRKVILNGGVQITVDFALSSNHEFYIDHKLLSCGITSMYIFENYLLFTSSSSKLYCLRLDNDYCLIEKQLVLTTLFSREIEQGSRIITATNGDLPRVILQAPRGNLETICCRPMAVDVVEQFLSINNWKAAIELMRTGRVNWNVLVDLNPERFLEHIPDFTQAADSLNFLSMIVTEFGYFDADYDVCLPKTANVVRDKFSIIKKVLEYLTSINCGTHLQSIVAIQHKHVSLKSAMHSIREVYIAGYADSDKICKKALQYLLLKDNLKAIMSAGYGFYDLEFLAFIFNNTGQDPKVFEPEIAELRLLDPVDLRFKMNVKANNPKNALKYLIRCELYDAEYVKNFIIKHKLQAFAYTTLPDYYKLYSMVASLYANKLSLQKRHSEAAYILKEVDLLPQALEEYRKALDWMEVIALMNKLEYDCDEKKAVLYHLSDHLVREHRIDEAVLLVEHHNKDYLEALNILVEHKQFKKAVSLARMYEAHYSLKETVMPNLRIHMTDLSERIDDFRTTFEKYFTRLKVVRENRKLSLNNQAPGDYDPDDDTVSESDSTSSRSSRGTTRTKGSAMSSRNRRKEERKKLDLRVGGYYEDIALMRALYLLYTDVFTLGPEVRDIALILEHEQAALAKDLHQKLAKLQDDMKREISVIWPKCFLVSPQIRDTNILAIIQNRDDLDPKFWTPPPEELLNAEWKIRMYSYSP